MRRNREKVRYLIRRFSDRACYGNLPLFPGLSPAFCLDGRHSANGTRRVPVLGLHNRKKTTAIRRRLERNHTVLRGQANGPPQGLGLVGLLPGKARQLAAEVAVAGRFAVDRPAQVERLDDAARRQLEVLADQLGDLVVASGRGRPCRRC